MIKFTNGLVLNKDFEIVQDDVYVDDNKIVAIGQSDIVADTVYDLDGNLLMPSFKNAHSHSGMTFGRSFADDMPLHSWLQNKIFPMEANMTGEDVKLLTKLAVMEYLTSGVTSIMDMYLTPYTIADACIETGMRVVQVSGINKFGPSLEEFEERYLKINGVSPLSTQLMGFHAEYTCDKSLLESLSDLAHKYKQPMFTHMSETASEVAGCVERYGMTPPVFLESLGLFDFGGAGYHLVHTTDEDIEVLKKKICPY